MANQIVLPSWVLIIRGLQLLLAIVILGMASYGAYWLRLSSWGWTIFTSLATVFIVVYSVLPERVAALQKIYNPFAVLAANATAVVFWLAAMGALAARRATFKYATTIESCYNDGSGGVCARGLEKRAAYVATWPYLNMMSACAGLCAIEMLLFIATVVVFGLAFKKQNSTTPQTHNLEAHGMQQQPSELGQNTQYAPQTQGQYGQQPYYSQPSGQQYQPVQQ